MPVSPGQKDDSSPDGYGKSHRVVDMGGVRCGIGKRVGRAKGESRRWEEGMYKGRRNDMDTG